MDALVNPAASAAAATTSTRNSLKVIFGQLTLDNVKQNDRKPSMYSAQLRQVVETHYPSGRAGNSAQPAIFDQAAFGFKDTIISNTRMAWLDVPKTVPATDEHGQPLYEQDGTTLKQREITMQDVLNQLAHYPNAGIQKVLSDMPILTEEQRGAIEAGLTTLDIVKYGADGRGGQLVRYGDNNTQGADPNSFVPGPNGREQFRAQYFKPDMTLPENQDKDLRLPKQVAQPGTAGVYGERTDHVQAGIVATAATPTRFNVAELPTSPSVEQAQAHPEPLLQGQGNNPAVDGPEVRGRNSNATFVEPATLPGANSNAVADGTEF